VVRLEKDLHFLFAGGQVELPGSIVETFINVLRTLFCVHSNYWTVSEEQVPGHVFTTFHLAQRLWGQQEGRSSRDIIVIPPINGSSALEEQFFGAYV